MKAKTAVLTAVETAEVIDRELPELGEHDVLVKIDANNICTSEYGAFNGARKRPLPLVFGHEWAGTVVEVGSAVDSVAVGDYIASGYQYDPYSEPSREGRTSECTKLQSADHPNPDGYFGNAGCANYAVAKEVACYKIDKGIDPSVAALLEPLGTCCAGFRRFGIEYGQTVVVIGAGTMGVLNALVAKAHGCRVIITEMMPKKLETAAKLGLETIDVSKCDPVEKVRELTGGKVQTASSSPLVLRALMPRLSRWPRRSVPTCLSSQQDTRRPSGSSTPTPCTIAAWSSWALTVPTPSTSARPPR